MFSLEPVGEKSTKRGKGEKSKFLALLVLATNWFCKPFPPDFLLLENIQREKTHTHTYLNLLQKDPQRVPRAKTMSQVYGGQDPHHFAFNCCPTGSSSAFNLQLDHICLLPVEHLSFLTLLYIQRPIAHLKGSNTLLLS